MPRHRGTYKPGHPEPYELGRSRVENFIQCPACFYLRQVRGVPFPSIPGFNVNEATDVLLKRDFDQFRGQAETHPFLKEKGLSHLIPYQHENFDLWTQSMHFGAEGRMHIVHEPTHLKIGGGLDDVWLNNKTLQLHIVDYKSTSQKSEGKEITLDGKWKESYKRQMDFYVWVMRQKGFEVSSTGYFLYCDGDRFSDYTFLGKTNAFMKFKMSLIPYEVSTDWVEPTLKKIINCLNSDVCPDHTSECEFGAFLSSMEVS